MVSPHQELQDEQPKENSQWLSDFRIFLRMYWKKGCTTQLSGCYCIMERESKLASKYLQNSLMLTIALNMSLSCSIFSKFWKSCIEDIGSFKSSGRLEVENSHPLRCLTTVRSRALFCFTIPIIRSRRRLFSHSGTVITKLEWKLRSQYKCHRCPTETHT